MLWILAEVTWTRSGDYLLIEQSPEHWQRDVEHQDPQHHLNLLDHTLLFTHKRTEGSRLHWRKGPGKTLGQEQVFFMLTEYFSSAQSNQCVLWGSCFDRFKRLLMANCKSESKDDVSVRNGSTTSTRCTLTWEELGEHLPRCSCTLPPGCFPEEDSSCTGRCQQ